MRYEVSPAHREHAAPRGSAVPSSRARDCWSRKSTKQPRVVWPISASARTMTVFLARQARLECRAAPVVASGRRHLVTGNGTGLPLGVAAAARLFETAVRGGRHEIEFWAELVAMLRIARPVRPGAERLGGWAQGRTFSVRAFSPEWPGWRPIPGGNATENRTHGCYYLAVGAR